MGRDVPFKADKVCDGCGATGAYDFMGDYFCQRCTDRAHFLDTLEKLANDPKVSAEGIGLRVRQHFAS